MSPFFACIFFILKKNIRFPSHQDVHFPFLPESLFNCISHEDFFRLYDILSVFLPKVFENHSFKANWSGVLLLIGGLENLRKSVFSSVANFFRNLERGGNSYCCCSAVRVCGTIISCPPSGYVLITAYLIKMTLKKKGKKNKEYNYMVIVIVIITIIIIFCFWSYFVFFFMSKNATHLCCNTESLLVQLDGKKNQVMHLNFFWCSRKYTKRLINTSSFFFLIGKKRIQ
jgi:hypothetical protein